MKWGLLSTANINRKLLEGVRGTDEATVVAVASRDRSRAEAFAREHGIERAHGSYEELLEDPRGRGDLHPAAQLAARAVVGAGARGGQARPVREAADAAAGGGRGGLRRRRAVGAAAGGGVHVAPPPADAAAARAARRGRDRPAAAGACVVLVPARARPRTSASTASSTAAALMDVGCYCVSGVAPRRGRRAGARVGRAGARGQGRRHRLLRHAALPRRRARPVRLRARRSQNRPGSRRSARTARCISPTRGTAGRPGSC